MPAFYCWHLAFMKLTLEVFTKNEKLLILGLGPYRFTLSSVASISTLFLCRLEYYFKRKKYLEGMLEAEALRLSNQARCDDSSIETKK